MCGLAGFIDPGRGRGGDELRAVAGRMAGELTHRGPDDGGAWADAAAGFGVGHRRLSILELSPAGHQPMISASGRFVIAFNGEIYNFKEIRSDLEKTGMAPAWRGNSDTEAMLEAISAWGLKKALGRFIGMFAFALWDRNERTLFLVRDRMGEKPLYYGWSGAAFLFASELKAMKAFPGFANRIDRDALAEFMTRGSIPSPRSIYEGISKLAPGNVLEFRAAEGRARTWAYWSLSECAESAQGNMLAADDDSAAEQL